MTDRNQEILVTQYKDLPFKNITRVHLCPYCNKFQHHLRMEVVRHIKGPDDEPRKGCRMREVLVGTIIRSDVVK